MRILQVVPYLYPALSYGGPAKVVYDLAKELAKKHEVTVYTSDAWNENRRILEKEKLSNLENFRIEYFPNLFNKLAYKYRIFSSFSMVYAYYKEKDNFDIIHINDVFVLSNLLIAALARYYEKPYVYSPHGVLDPIRIKRKLFLKKIIIGLFARNILQGSSRVIATSDKEKKELTKLGFKKVTTVYNGIPTNIISPGKIFTRLNKEGVFTMLYIGKIHPLKGLKELIEALSSVDFNFQLLIAGPDDGQELALRKLIAKLKLKNIHFLGFVNDKQKAELFKLSDLFVHPSFSEGFSISILEAMNSELPVLITEACNFPDEGRFNAGKIISTRDLIEDLKKSLTEFQKRPASLKKFGKNARMLVQKHYSISVMAQNIEKIYEVFN